MVGKVKGCGGESAELANRRCNKDGMTWIKIMVKYAAQLITFVYPSKFKTNYARQHNSNLGVLKCQ